MTKQTQTFVLEIDGKPTLAFEARSVAEAQEICSDPDLKADLCTLTSAGIPICADTAALSARPAKRREIVSFQRAVQLAPASDEPTMVFLVNLDGVVVVAIDPE